MLLISWGGLVHVVLRKMATMNLNVFSLSPTFPVISMLSVCHKHIKLYLFFQISHNLCFSFCELLDYLTFSSFKDYITQISVDKAITSRHCATDDSHSQENYCELT